MDLSITGRVVQILEEQSGTSKNGPWRKQDFILETEGQYPKQVCVTQWGDNIEQFGVQEGERLTAHIDLQSREYKGRWYTDVKAWRVDRDEAGAPGPDDLPPMGPPPSSGTDDDLPF
ncbi:MAG: DUF3127 domain-containing protein [Gemmatimonadota bacterium]|jgi:hypothetical protein